MVTSSLLCTRPLRVSSTLPCEWPVQGRQECGPPGAEVRAAWAQVTLTRRLLGAGCWRYWPGLGWSSGIRVMLLSGRVRTGLDLPLTCQITLHRSWPFSGPQFPHMCVGVWAGADEPLACSFAAHFYLPPHGKIERLSPREGRDPHHPAQRYPTRR